VIIPNGDVLSQQIVNWTLSNSQQRLHMDLKVKGNNDMEVVTSAVKKAILATGFIYENREPSVLFTKVYDDGFELKVFFWCLDVSKSGEAKSAIMLSLYQALKAQGIQMI
jgi:small-conductance mechanosensitive channel